jgi:hypothetical protein
VAYWLSIEEQIYIQDLQESGKIVHPCISEWIGVDEQENYRCLAWIQVTEDAFVVAQTGMRNQQFPVDQSDILNQIAVFDVRRGIDRFLANEVYSSSYNQVDALVESYKSKFDMRQCGGISTHWVSSAIPRPK